MDSSWKHPMVETASNLPVYPQRHGERYCDNAFSMDSSRKHPMVETASDLPVYPQRHGERYCDNYMLTRTCKFRERCIFDHPLWVPEGGIQDYKEGGEHSTIAQPWSQGSAPLPPLPSMPSDRPSLVAYGGPCVKSSGQPVRREPPQGTVSCDYPSVSLYERCKDRDCSCYTTKSFSFGSELNQPMVSFAPAQVHYSEELPIRPGKEDCLGYINNGSCMYGTNCQFNHPKTANPPPAVASVNTMIQPMIPYGECNEIFGSNRHFNHHERNSIHVPSAAALPNAMIQSALPFGKYSNHPTDEVFNLPSLDLQNMNLDSVIASLDEEQAIHPQRPGEINCNLDMKTGHCIFGERCKFQHLNDWLPPRVVTENQALQPNVKHSLAVLPRREKTVACEYYMDTGLCMFGFACPFDHPPPREVLAMARAQEGAAGSASETQTAPFVLHGIIACDYYMNTGVCEYGFACKRYHPPPKEILAVAKAQEGAARSVTKRKQRPQ